MTSHVKIILPENDDDLLDLCRIETFRASGKGGQHVNKTDSAVRLIYLPNNITVTCQEERSQYTNKMRCLDKLREKVEKLNYKKPRRIATRKTKSQKEKEKVKKQQKSEKKQQRKRVTFDNS